MRINQSRADVRFEIELDKYVFTHNTEITTTKADEIQRYCEILAKCKDVQDARFFAKAIERLGGKVPSHYLLEQNQPERRKPTSLHMMRKQHLNRFHDTLDMNEPIGKEFKAWFESQKEWDFNTVVYHSCLMCEKLHEDRSLAYVLILELIPFFSILRMGSMFKNASVSANKSQIPPLQQFIQRLKK